MEERKYLCVFRELISRFYSDVVFDFKIAKIKNSKVICLHPQTIGLFKFLRLAERNEFYFYVMDNSFFCMMSYNYDEKNKGECLKCIDDAAQSDDRCYPFVTNETKGDYLKYQSQLKGISHNIHFLSQNVLQEKMLRRVFGKDIKCDVVGHDTGELEDDNQDVSGQIVYDCVYHGGVHLAKGLEYFIRLAEEMPLYRFFVPAGRKKCEVEIGRAISAKNIQFYECSWETGLRKAIGECKVVVNPSLWSAPIEGALLKSVAYGRIVATVSTEYGYENELSESCEIIRLPQDVKLAKHKLVPVLNREIPSRFIKIDELLPKTHRNLFEVVRD